MPDSVHTAHVPITLGTLHIDMVINLATKSELAMKGAQLVNSKDVQIVYQIYDVVKITKDVPLAPFWTIKAIGVT